VFLAALVIVLAGLAAYANSFHGGFVLDDLPAIKENTTIQNGWAAPSSSTSQSSGVLERIYQGLPAPLQPPNEGQPVMGRPLVNASFALNYEWAKSHQTDAFAPEGYHFVNLAIHLLAGLTFFGLVRRTLELPKLHAQLSTAALPVAFMAALWWTVHPLQTESVTYLAQRAESLMGFFYLLTFYCFIRGTQSQPRLWYILATLACALAGLSKEVTATLPLMILLYDWIFVSEKFAEPFVRRWPIYISLLLALLPMAFLIHHAGNRGNTAGFNVNLKWYDYAAVQFPAIMNYLKQAFWPHPLIIDYRNNDNLGDLPLTNSDCLAMFAVMMLVAGTAYLLWRKPKLGFLGAWFFVILAPSSSILPIVTEQVAEHRMYLPLVSMTVFSALGLWTLWKWRALPAALAVAVALGALTYTRNNDYRNSFTLSLDAVTKNPDIARTHANYGIMLNESGRILESVAEYLAAERLKPNYPECDVNLGNSLSALGQNEEAAKYYVRALPKLLSQSDQATASYNLGNALLALRRYDDALKAYNYAGGVGHNSQAYYNMGYIYNQLQNNAQAVACFLQALHFQPVYPECESTLGNVYVQLNQLDLAEQHYLRAIQQDPNFAEAHAHLGILYANLNKNAEAAREFAAFIQLAPAKSNSAPAHNLRGFVLSKLGRYAEAVAEYEQALMLQPDFPECAANLAAARQQIAEGRQ